VLRVCNVFLHDFHGRGQRFLAELYFEFVSLLRLKAKTVLKSKDCSQKTTNTELSPSLVVTALLWEKGRCLSMGMQGSLVPLNENIPGE